MKKWIGSKLSNLADKKLESLGFVKTEEKEHSAFYEKEVKEFNYIHAIDIYFKYSGKDIVMSYEYNVDFSIAVALEYKELFWSGVKLIAMKWKYDWDSCRKKKLSKS